MRIIDVEQDAVSHRRETSWSLLLSLATAPALALVALWSNRNTQA